MPSVTAGSFEAADGSVGTILANATPQPQQAAVKLAAPGKSAALYRADRTEEQRWDGTPTEVPVWLEPFGTRMLIYGVRRP